MATSLSEAQISDYWRDGLIRPIRVFSASEAAEIREQIEGLEYRCKVEGLVPDINQYFRVNGQVVIPFLADTARNGTILDAVEGIIGPNIMIWSCELFMKDSGTMTIVSWHQDLTYWGMGGSDLQATAWIAITDATQESGCMRYVPGSHFQNLVAHIDTYADENLLSRGQEVAIEVDEADARLDELKAGEMSIHHGRLFHASGPNYSSDRRIGLVIRYISPNLVRSVPGRDYAMLARGMNKQGNWITIAPPSTLFGRSETLLYDRIIKDQSVVQTKGADRTVPLYDA